MQITRITHHYSATYADQDIGVKEIDAMHKARGWSGVGYHYVIRRDGTIEKGRPDTERGAHVKNHNTGNLGICCIGGLDRATGPNVGVDNRTMAQKVAALQLTRDLLAKHPGAEVLGHRDLAATRCPGFDVRKWWAEANTAKPSDIPAKERPLMASTTLQASGAQIFAGAASGVTALGYLSGPAQIVAMVLAGVVILGALWIMRERIRHWAEGVK